MMHRTCQHSLRTKARNGFTLLEVLVALVLIGFLLLMLYGSLYAGARHWRAGEVRAQENDDTRLVLPFIRRIMGETLPMFLADRQGTRVMFRGDDASLQFVSRLPAYHAGSGIYLLKLVAEDDELLLRYTPLNRDKAMFGEDVFVEAERISLLENIETIDLDYFGRDTPNAEPAWHTAFNITSEGLAGRSRLTLDVVVTLNNDPRLPYSILSWRESKPSYTDTQDENASHKHVPDGRRSTT